MKHQPKDIAKSHRLLTRRGLFLGAVQVGLVGVLGARMRSMQVEQADQFRLLAEENRINIRLIPPARGLIFDRNGLPVATNRQAYKISIVREDAGDVADVIARVAALVRLDPSDVERALKEIKRRSAFVPVTLADNLSWKDIAEIAVNAPALPGITPEVGLTRQYPLAEDYTHIIGYVGPVSDYDLSKINDPDPLLQIPKFQIGKSGAEAKLEKTLRGKAGIKRIEVNSIGRIMRELDRQEGITGANVQLTINSQLQNYVQARLANEAASAVVIDLTDGDLLAIGSTPSFDPNKFVTGISYADYNDLLENKYRPLVNKAVQGTYPPASTFKMLTALAALNEEAVGPKDTIRCRGHVEVGSRKFHCWKRSGHGNMNLKNSLKKSCDVYYYELAQRTGIEKIHEMAIKFGLGTRFPIPMSAVARGLMPNKAWKLKNRDADWVVGDTLNASIGQGFVLTSPLQMAIMAARIGSGRSVTPRLVKSINGVEQPSGGGEKLDVNENHLRMIRKAMYEVSNSRSGTAYRSRIIKDDYRMAGKTGTAQVGNSIVKNADVEWEKRDHAMFVAFAPYDNPRIAVSVVVEHGGGGSKTAAPIARDIVLQALYDGKPPLGAYPKSDRPRIRKAQAALELRDFDALKNSDDA